MTRKQLIAFLEECKKPEGMSDREFDSMEITVTTMDGIEFIAEFKEKMGVTMITSMDGESKYVFNLLTEEVEEQLYEPNELEEKFGFNAMEELIMVSQERIEYDKN